MSRFPAGTASLTELFGWMCSVHLCLKWPLVTRLLGLPLVNHRSEIPVYTDE
jgi:hypothetical protein